jgi:5'-deoxynucleotidase
VNGSFFAMMQRMRYINRWGLMRNTQSENIQEHSLEVAMIAHALPSSAPAVSRTTPDVDPDRVVAYAVYHDATEILTGDLPTPVKYHNESIRTRMPGRKSGRRHAARDAPGRYARNISSTAEPGPFGSGGL